MEDFFSHIFDSLPVIVTGLTIYFFVQKFIRREIAARQAYNAALSAFRWDPDMDPLTFERHCADFLCLQGWRARTTKGSGDQGVDVLAEKAGVRIVLQCKKYSRPVGNKAVQEAYAARAFAGAHASAVVTNVGYTQGAKKLAQSTGVLLLHFTDLANADRLFGIQPQNLKHSIDAQFFEDQDTSGRVTHPCPNCRLMLRLPKGRTGMVRCPKCSSRFKAVT